MMQVAMIQSLLVVTSGALAVILLAGVGCRRHSSQRAGDPAVIAYGYGPEPNRHITYQPDVVMIGGGPHAIRSAGADGFTWTIDGRTKGAADLSVGKVMFASTRAVGRVIALQRRGDDLAVTVAPVGLTEVIRDGIINVDTEIEPGALVSHLSVDSDASASALRPAEKFYSAALPVRKATIFRRVDETRKMSAKFKLGDFELEPYMKHKGQLGMSDEDIQGDYPQTNPPIEPVPNRKDKEESRSTMWGLKVQYIADKKMKFGTDIYLAGEHVRIRSHTAITNGKVAGDSTFVIDGIDRLSIGLLGGTELGASENIKARMEIPFDLAEQIPPEMTYGVPIAVHFKFKFLIETILSGRNSTLWAKGNYKLTGPIGVEGGKLLAPKLELQDPQKPLLDLSGVTIGTSGIVYAVEFRSLVGLGTELAMTGPYFKFVVALGTAQGSVFGVPIANCRGATLKGDGAYGIGVVIDSKAWSRLQQVAGGKLKKTELELLETSTTMFKKSWTAPDVPLCRNAVGN